MLMLSWLLGSPGTKFPGGNSDLPKPADSPIFKNRTPLPANHYYLLPLTSIRPRGWLRRQLEIQALGLSGHLDEFWPDLGPSSGWLGGTGESWERGPYFLDGLVPLAYLLDDPKLIAKIKPWLEWTLTHQRPDGSIGPAKNTDWWPNMIMLKVLTQYQEATGDPRVIPLLERYFSHQLRLLSQRPLKEWAIYRWADELLSVLWLYNHNGDPHLLELANLLHKQGYDWKDHFAHFEFPAKVQKSQANLKSHVVNNAMALKTSAVWWLVSRDPSDREAVSRQFRELDQYHLLPNGVHSGDEHYAGRNPSQGTELCAVVEGMFSLEHLIAVLGEPALGDRLEKISFNALPATFSGDMWAHQYDQQPNQVLCSLAKRDWTTNGPESNLFGLEPNFGCCTSNLHQGWPKLVASLWMATPDDGLAAVAYAPSEVQTRVKGGVPVRIIEETNYPFRDKIHLTIDPAAPVAFPLELRIPAWAQGASILINGKAVGEIKTGIFHRIEREWNKGDRLELTFPMAPRISRWYNDSLAIERGPLVFSLKIGEDWRKIRDKAPAADWEVHPTTPWNYGLRVDSANPAKSIQVTEHDLGQSPFTPEGVPLELRVKGRRLPEWKLIRGSAGPPPPSPVSTTEQEETLTLIPYGSAKLRITAFPQLAN
jgi:hypothetical protein